MGDGVAVAVEAGIFEWVAGVWIETPRAIVAGAVRDQPWRREAAHGRLADRGAGPNALGIYTVAIGRVPVAFDAFEAILRAGVSPVAAPVVLAEPDGPPSVALADLGGRVLHDGTAGRLRGSG